jgi:predicted enzyme related to lactoylglutathione lyase
MRLTSFNRFGIITLCLVCVASAQNRKNATQPPQLPDTAVPEIAGTGNFSHIVTSLEKSVEFYHDVLGLDVATPPGTFSPNPAIMKLGNTIGAQSRIAVVKVPGAAIGLELIEYKDIDRKPAHPRFQDPGTGNFAIQLKDIATVADRVKKSGAHVLTLAGSPVDIGVEKGFFVQDPDGFVVELTQFNTPPPAAANAPGNLFGASVEITVADTEQTAKFYRDMGFTMRVGDSFTENKLMADTAGTPGATFRQSSTTVPGSMVRISFIEFKNIERKPLQTRVQDPGTAIIQLRVRDVDEAMKKFKAAGATVISTGGEPVTMGNRRLAIVRDPNNLFLELLPAQ